MATELARKIYGTRQYLGRKLRSLWVEASSVDCEPLTFGDLEVGDKFIVMPVPDDNGYDSRLLNGSYLFMKVEHYFRGDASLADVRNCIQIFGKRYSSAYFSESELVIKVE